MSRPRIRKTEKVSSSNFRVRIQLKQANAAGCILPSKLRNTNYIFTETKELKLNRNL